jgi:hypothetical protein
LLSPSEFNHRKPIACGFELVFEAEKQEYPRLPEFSGHPNPMKKSGVIAIIILLLLFTIVAFSFITKSSAPPKSVVIQPTATETNTAPVAAAQPETPAATPVPAPAPAPVAKPVAPEKVPDAPAPTKPETKPAPTPQPVPTTVTKIVEMPAATPPPPANFYPSDIATNKFYSLRFRAGYQHANHGNNNSTAWLSAKGSVNSDQWRQRAGKNGWLVPDADAEISHQDLAKKSSASGNGDTGEGVQAQASLFWPWKHWTVANSHTNAACPFSGPAALALGPTVNGGFDQLFDGSSPQLFSHGGARLTINGDGYLEYTFGGAENLPGVRQQLVGELPIFQSRNGEIRYLVRGLWDHTTGSHPDLLQGAFLVEMPLDIFTSRDKWRDLLPFKK